MLKKLSQSVIYQCASIKVPIIDVKAFLTESPSAKSDCKQVAEALHKYGCLVIKDPRVNQAQNDKFLDTLEKYFSTRSKDYYANKPTKDIYPNYDYQVGATP
jgi:isopenicillin N synthase-like dioxygenase